MLQPTLFSAVRSITTRSLVCAQPPASAFIAPLATRSLSTTAPTFSGHSRWSKIRHKKGAVDARRGRFFSKLMSEVHLALKPPYSNNPDQNPRLLAAVQRARDAGVPKANIEGAFERARKMADGTGKTVVFEAVGPGGKTALMVECLTENPARAVSRVKELMSRSWCRMSPVSFLFERKGIVRVEPLPESGATFDGLFDVALEGGAEDVREIAGDEGIVWEVSCASTDLGSLTSLLTTSPNDAHYALQSSELAFIPIDPLQVIAEGEEGDGVPEDKALALAKAVDMIEEDSDVVKVYTNLAEADE